MPPAQPQSIQLGEDQFYVADNKLDTASDVLVFLHGFPLNHAMWSAQLDAFDKTYRVIAPDLRGHGASSVTEGTVTMRQMADDVAGLLDAMKINTPITLCGLSMGGYVAWEFWRAYPQRLARLIMCDTRAVADTEEVARARQMMAAQVVASGSQLAAESMTPKLFASSTQTDQPEKVELVRNMILNTDPQGIAATQRGMAQRVDMTPHLSNITTPTLVLCGAADTISPPTEMQSFANEMPSATFVEILNAGHLAPLENPTACNHAIRDFLAST